MTIELIHYCFTILIAIILSYSFKPIDYNFKLVWHCYFLIHSAIIRLNFQSDILVYANEMKNYTISLYSLREPFIWYGHKLLYFFLKSEYLSFLTLDLIIGNVLFNALNKLKSARFIYYSILVSFPFILGFQNIYRQWAAECILLYFVATIIKSEIPTKKSIFYFLLALLTHNSAGLFLPILTLTSRKRKLTALITISFIGLAIYYLKDSKSQASTGANFELVYLSVFLVSFFTLIFLDKLKIIKQHFDFYLVLTLNLIIGVIALYLLSSTGSERMFIFIIFLCYPLIVKKLEEKFIQKSTIRIIYAMIFFLPIILTNLRVFIVE